MTKAQNIKSGNVYIILREDVRNATNAQEGQIMVLYQSMNTGKVYVREHTEFFDKFVKIKK